MSSDYRNYDKPSIVAPPSQPIKEADQAEAGQKLGKQSSILAKTEIVSKEILPKLNEELNPRQPKELEAQFDRNFSNESSEKAAQVAQRNENFNLPLNEKQQTPLDKPPNQSPIHIEQSLIAEEPEPLSQSRIIGFTHEQFAALTPEELKNLTPEQLDSLTVEQLEEYLLKTGDLEESEKSKINEATKTISTAEEVIVQNKEIAAQKESVVTSSEENASDALGKISKASQKAEVAEETASQGEILEAGLTQKVTEKLEEFKHKMEHAFVILGGVAKHFSTLTPEELESDFLKHAVNLDHEKGELSHAAGYSHQYAPGMSIPILLANGSTVNVILRKIREMSKEEHEAFTIHFNQLLSAQFPKMSEHKVEEKGDERGKKLGDHHKMRQPNIEIREKDDTKEMLLQETKMQRDAEEEYRELEKHIEEERTQAHINRKIRLRNEELEETMKEDQDSSIDKTKREKSARTNAAQKKSTQKSEIIDPTTKAKPISPPRSPLDV